MIYTFGDWQLDIDRYELHCGQELIYLEPQVFKVLAFLIRNRDRIVSKRELISNLWPKQHISESALERCIMGARKAVGDDGDKQRIIKTFYRRGYRFVAPVTEALPDVVDALGSQLPPSLQLIGAPGRLDTGHSLAQPHAGVALSEAPSRPSRSTIALPPRGGAAEPAHRQATILSCFIVYPDGTSRERMQPVMDQIVAQVKDHMASSP